MTEAEWKARYAADPGAWLVDCVHGARVEPDHVAIARATWRLAHWDCPAPREYRSAPVTACQRACLEGDP